MVAMHELVDLGRYPLDRPGSKPWADLVAECQEKLRQNGLFNLDGFIRKEAIESATKPLRAAIKREAFTHARRHNIYFKREIDGLAADHPALKEFDTSNCTICADQIEDTAVVQLYDWPRFAEFLAAVMGKEALYTMDDRLACLNVMAYSAGQALNWHFDRSEFTTTLLLQAPTGGGDFEYDRDLRSDDDPNYDGVADLIEGRRTPSRIEVEPGTLNVFKGKNTAHRVTPIKGAQDRIIAVFSYYERPGVTFSDEDRMGFFGRAS